ncbi:hypothetical protein TREMEDRAFT_65795 [Tremella mesenterica DSM 1558]|uniref:uncharacterized protein n=1 Tax=Tremella mesenterica (strain ATCC 24925 / CBS 8224 / DSM 1558 / NBRC 9311 / NRRL Y-6157 / RJB 2259-6 / UBC 559-6) TaxID=578456 RepID=UPI00032D2E2B|nr:uncharacterized protein TREMEDRAFT_65795 [Tremella mesenterica DSM 1558]EIW66189.1 hypothetical protein TREMEDRAFT_65795 [Tremella mesenterica DSM 1558]
MSMGKPWSNPMGKATRESDNLGPNKVNKELFYMCYHVTLGQSGKYFWCCRETLGKLQASLKDDSDLIVVGISSQQETERFTTPETDQTCTIERLDANIGPILGVWNTHLDTFWPSKDVQAHEVPQSFRSRLIR